MSSYGTSYYPAKSANNPRPSTGYSAASSNSVQSSRSRSYGGRPQAVVIHNGGGSTKDSPNSSSASNSGYWK
ncbi:hypothetical protein N0V86_000739 [Didymella sp. IMI 355093]|nr:hypothetical protein N0V86_000739 [Didymella sp. IMI 355093]